MPALSYAIQGRGRTPEVYVITMVLELSNGPPNKTKLVGVRMTVKVGDVCVVARPCGDGEMMFDLMCCCGACGLNGWVRWVGAPSSSCPFPRLTIGSRAVWGKHHSLTGYAAW